MARMASNSPLNEAAAQGRRALAALRVLKGREAAKDLIAFTELTMPDQNHPDDPRRSRYRAQTFHRALAAALEEVEAGKVLRLIITFPPRHGKSELTSRRFPAWLLGKDPYRHVMLGTFNQEAADTFGRNVREIMLSPAFRQIFPNCVLETGQRAADRLGTTEGGQAFFLGREGTATSRGADVLIIDDPLKSRAEANSQATRNEIWDWFTDTMSTRLMTDMGAIVVIQTRWNDDDIVGRLTDPENPHYNEEEAKLWKIINIRAIAEDDDVLGRPIGEPLWPDRFGIEYLEAKRRANPNGFSSLYQQNPSPADGAFFKVEHLQVYQSNRRPSLGELRVFAASDHAVATKQENDPTCLLIAGVDSNDVIWLLDCWWKRAPSDQVVEAMLDLQQRWKPIVWWAENGHITKSIGPFLRTRQRERKIYINLRAGSVAADKVTRAQSILGRAAMGMLRFPKSEPWCENARNELLRFPNGRHDDFVDAVAHLGLGLDQVRGRREPNAANDRGRPEVGTLSWVKWAASQQRAATRRINLTGGM